MLKLNVVTRCSRILLPTLIAFWATAVLADDKCDRDIRQGMAELAPVIQLNEDYKVKNGTSRGHLEEQIRSVREAVEQQGEACRRYQYLVSEKGKAEYMEAARREIEAEEEAERLKGLPEPKIGMTVAQVVNNSRWGRPDRVNRTTTKRRVSEQWVYGNRNYLYFEDGRLVSIGTSQ